MFGSENGYGIKIEYQTLYKACDLNAKYSSKQDDRAVTRFFEQMKVLLKETRKHNKKDWAIDKDIN
jgi:hypothetical protein